MKKTDKDSTSAKALKIGAAAALVTLSTIPSIKAIAATATLPVLTRLFRAIEITVNASLDFGTLAFTNEQPGQARLDPATNTLITDGSNSIIQAGGVPKAGRIRVKGFNAPVQISVEQNSIQLTNGETFVTVDDFRFINSTIGSRVTVTPNAAEGSIIVPIGATLKTRVGQLTGTYIGSNRIYANYQ